MNDLGDFEFKIARIDLLPGDILVLKFPFQITHESARRMEFIVKEITGGHRALILDGGADLAILTAAEIDARLEPHQSTEFAA